MLPAQACIHPVPICDSFTEAIVYSVGPQNTWRASARIERVNAKFFLRSFPDGNIVLIKRDDPITVRKALNSRRVRIEPVRCSDRHK